MENGKDNYINFNWEQNGKQKIENIHVREKMSGKDVVLRG